MAWLKINVRREAKTIAGLLLVGALIAFSERKHDVITVRDVHIRMQNIGDNHFMDEAEALSDHVHIVDAGRVIASGSPTDLVRGGDSSTIRLVAESHLDAAKLAASLPDGTTVHETQPGHYAIAGAVEPGLLAGVAQWCADQGVLAQSISVQRQTLEDRFLELTGRALR